MDDVMKAEFEAWLETRPAAIAAVARRFPPMLCYKLTSEPRGHYCIVSYSEPVDGSDVQVRVRHLHDSWDAGREVFGVDPNHLVPCGCLVN